MLGGRSCRTARSTLAGVRGIVFDLFHTLVDPEDFRPRESWRLGHVAEVIGANGRDLIMFWKDTYDERTTSPISGTKLIGRYAADNGLDVSPEQQDRIAAHLGDYQDLALEQPRTEVLEAVADLAEGAPAGGPEQLLHRGGGGLAPITPGGLLHRSRLLL